VGTAPSRDRLVGLLTPVVAARGLDLEDVVVTPAGRRRLVRVVVDRDGGVGLDAVAEVSSAVSAALDESEAMGAAPYVLEVTSPGVDRPLRERRHWLRARQRLVRVTGPDGRSTTGRLTEVDDEGLALDVDGQSRRLGWDDVTVGRVEVELNRRPNAEEE
jgi:ribosome maturation factor RimP